MLSISRSRFMLNIRKLNVAAPGAADAGHALDETVIAAVPEAAGTGRDLAAALLLHLGRLLFHLSRLLFHLGRLLLTLESPSVIPIKDLESCCFVATFGATCVDGLCMD